MLFFKTDINLVYMVTLVLIQELKHLGLAVHPLACRLCVDVSVLLLFVEVVCQGVKTSVEPLKRVLQDVECL